MRVCDKACATHCRPGTVACEYLRSNNYVRTLRLRSLNGFWQPVRRFLLRTPCQQSTKSYTECLSQVDPLIGATALYALSERHSVSVETLRQAGLSEDPVVRNTAEGLLARESSPHEAAFQTLTIEKMLALYSVDLFRKLSPEGLLSLAQASKSEELLPGTVLCREGEEGNEVFILLKGSVSLFKKIENRDEFLGSEAVGGLIGEMAVLDLAPRSATVIAGESGVSILRLDGAEFRAALEQHSSIANDVIRTLAKRLRARGISGHDADSVR